MIGKVWRRTAHAHRLWIFFFLAVQAFFGMKGGTNAHSRLALLSALVEDQTFVITPYREWTVDWAETPDGKVYSNKAPGPALLALPVFWALDRLLVHAPERADRDLQRRANSSFTLPILSFLFQVLPWAVLAILFLALLESQGIGRGGQSLFLFAFLFGNTASLFLNSFFGHGFAAVASVACLYFFLERKYAWLGLAWGVALLSDYGMAFSFPFLVGSVLADGPALGMQKRILRLLVGGLAPLVLWAVYHDRCFGSVFTLPQAFQNPLFVDLKEDASAVWGVIGLFPKLGIVGELLFGTTRGILWTQPWVLWVLVAMGWHWRWIKNRRGLALTLGTFGGLLWMNSAFGAWHGGGTPGPRYLASALPLFAYWLPSLRGGRKADEAIYATSKLERAGRKINLLLPAALVTVACLWFLIVFSSLSVATGGTDPLWPHYVGLLTARTTNTLRAAFLFAASAALLKRTWRELV